MTKLTRSLLTLVFTLCTQMLFANSIKIDVVHFPDDVTNSKGMINNDLLKNELGIVDWSLASPSRYVLSAEVEEIYSKYIVILTTTREQITFDMGTDYTYAHNLARVFNEEHVLRLLYRGDWDREFQKSLGATYFNKKQNLLDYYMIDLESVRIALDDGSEEVVPALNGKKLSSKVVRANINSRF